MKRLLLALSLSLLAGQGLAEGPGAPPPVPAASPNNFVANGEAIDIPGTGFSIVPPTGWEVQREGGGTAVVFQGPKPEEKPGVTVYRGNIRIMRIAEGLPMDDQTKENFKKDLMEKFPASNRISNYNIRSAERVQLASGAEGFLYYSEMTYDALPIMAMHVLISSATDHFLITYMDIAKNFEQENSPALTTAYTSIQSAKLETAPAERFTTYYYVGGGIGALLLLLIFVRIARGLRMKKLGESLESEDGGDDNGGGYDNTSTMTRVSSRGRSSASYEDEDDDDGHESYAQPATREAPKPQPKAPAPAPVAKKAAPAPIPKTTPAPAPTPAPAMKSPAPPPAAKAAEPPRRPEPAPISEISSVAASEHPVSDAAPLTGAAWNLKEEEADEDFTSDVSVIQKKKDKEKPAPKAVKSKHQTKGKTKEVEPEDNEDMSTVARLSEVIPQNVEVKRKKSFFSWGKSKAKDTAVDHDEVDGDDDWDNESRRHKKEAKAKPQAISGVQPVSEVSHIAGDSWNLQGGGQPHSHVADDEED